MKFDVRIGGDTHIVELERNADRWRVAIDGQPLDADGVEIAPNTFSILLRGQSHEIRVTPSPNGTLTMQTRLEEFTAEVLDPRAWRGRRHSVLEATGRQQVVAPMPGKVVRLLVKAGDAVEAGQGLLVVEAMKMQNEIRSPKSGVVERLHAKEGQPVNAGDILAWVE
jgi:biotin carboxyl carrier protein